MGACFAGHVFGDGSLDAGSGESEGEGQHRCNQLINAHAFSAEGVGQENAIEKADKAAEQSG